MSAPAQKTRPEDSLRFRPPAVSRVRMDGFFGPRIDTIAEKTAATLFERCMAAGMMDQVDPDRPSPGIRIPKRGNVSTQMFWDSDLGKSIEASAYALFRRPNPELEASVDAVIDAYRRLQDDNGYLNSWYQRIEPGKRWTNLRDCHELYNAGHLMEGAVAYFDATGKRTFLDIMARYADHIATVFGSGADQKHGYSGHPEIELALVRLSRATENPKYLELARYFVDQRGRQPHYFDEEARTRGEDPADFHFKTYEYCQAHAPVRDQDAVVGHAVRAPYLYSGMADVATEFGDDSLTPPLERLWAHLTEKNLYIHGGFGPSSFNEGMTVDYDLPNESAYAETCAAVALVFWANRMLGRGPNARYGDIMEQALYNGALSGLSLDGTRFFYENPLESRGGHHRWTWHHCPCCPPNITRLVASVGQYAYGVAQDEIAVHLYCESAADLAAAGGPVRIAQKTEYPFSGAVHLDIEPDAPRLFAVSLRLPEWSPECRISVNGKRVDANAIVHNGYARIEREWSPGDTIDLEIDMPVRTMRAHPKVQNDAGRVALMRGPLVYCLEGADNGEDLNSLVLPRGSRFRCEPVDKLDGAIAIETEAYRERDDFSHALYRSDEPTTDPATVRAVPYYAWDNREAGEMLVWIRAQG